MRSRRAALWFVSAVGALSLAADFISPHSYSEQFRDVARAAPSRRFPLGTDDLGRDRLSRLIHGSRISFLCAGGAALAATTAGAAIGLLAGYGGGTAVLINGVTDLFLSLPWLFFLLTVRALFPLNTSPELSVGITFLLLAGTGWASGARVMRAVVADLQVSGAILHARSCGCGGFRLMWSHVLPNLKQVVVAQFWTLLPAFVLAEANLGILGLGVSEPLPSWGNILAELSKYDRIPDAPWLLAPAILLVLVVASLYLILAEVKICDT